MKKLLSSGLAIGAMISLVGCGGGSSSSTPSTVTGQFVDTYVAGLNYECSSGKTDVTNDMGEYTCNTGDTVTFSLGDYVLGSTTASSGIVTPEDIQPDNPDAALNIAQLLQTLDTDPDDDIISIDGNFTDLDDSTVELNSTTFDTDIVEDLVEIDQLVDEDTATTHLQETELMLLLAGKTFYTVESDYVDSLVINADVTSATWTTIVGYVGETGTDGLEIMTTDGTLITRLKVVPEEQGEDPFHLVLNEGLSTDDYLLFDVAEAEEQIRFYFDQATAEAYYDSLQPSDLEALIVGETRYYANSLGGTGYRNLAEDGSYTGSLTLENGTIFDENGTYEIIDNVLTVYRTNPSDATLVITFTGEEEAGGLVVTVSIDGGEVFQAVTFATEAERDAYVDSLQSAIPITQSMLDSKTFFHYENEIQYSEEIYAKMTFSGGVLTRTEIINGGAPDTFTMDYIITTDGQIKIDIPAMDGDPSEYIYLTLQSETSNSWTMRDEEDTNQDGTIDFTDTLTLYLSKPVDYPDFTVLPDLETLLVGNTFYQPIQDTTQTPTAEWIAELTFNANGTKVVVDDGIPETGTYTIDGDTLTSDDGDGPSIHTLTDVTDTYIEFDSSIDGTWYLTLEAAQAADPVIWN